MAVGLPAFVSSLRGSPEVNPGEEGIHSPSRKPSSPDPLVQVSSHHSRRPASGKDVKTRAERTSIAYLEWTAHTRFCPVRPSGIRTPHVYCRHAHPTKYAQLSLSQAHTIPTAQYTLVNISGRNSSAAPAPLSTALPDTAGTGGGNSVGWIRPVSVTEEVKG